MMVDIALANVPIENYIEFATAHGVVGSRLLECPTLYLAQKHNLLMVPFLRPYKDPITDSHRPYPSCTEQGYCDVQCYGLAKLKEYGEAMNAMKDEANKLQDKLQLVECNKDGYAQIHKSELKKVVEWFRMFNRAHHPDWSSKMAVFMKIKSFERK